MNAPGPLPQTTAEVDVDALVGDVARLEAIVAGWDDGQQAVAFALRRAVDALNRAALRRLIAGVKDAPGALEALRAAAADPLVYAVLRHHGLVQPSLQERVEAALETVRPMLAAHGGDVEFVAFAPPDAIDVRFLGNCDGCPASVLTFVAGVKRAIEEHCPEIVTVRQVKGTAGGAGRVDFVSPFAAGGEGRWSFAARLDAVPEGGVRAAVVAGEPVILSRIGRVVTCFQDACSHLGLPISEGEVADGRIVCPHHGFEYDLMSGECLTAPAVQLRTHAVRLVGDRVEVRLQG
jgi:nitrite reductase/ring-hydroxylating ferredoxin subunit/Fe-S cluster biogenesis protein NfuA